MQLVHLYDMNKPKWYKSCWLKDMCVILLLSFALALWTLLCYFSCRVERANKTAWVEQERRRTVALEAISEAIGTQEPAGLE